MLLQRTSRARAGVLLICCYYSPLTSRSKAVVPLLREGGPVLSSLCPRSLPGSIASLTRFLSSLFSGKRPSSAREKSTISPSLVSRVTSKVPSPDEVQRERGRARLEGALPSGPGCAPGRGGAPCALRESQSGPCKRGDLYWRLLPRWFGMSATSPTVPLNVVSSSCAVQALRIIQLHLVQYSIAIRGDLMVIGLLAIATTTDDARLAPEYLTDRGPASRLREDGSSASTNHITCRIDRIETATATRKLHGG